MSTESTVKDILLQKKSRAVYSIDAKSSVLTALQLMATYDVAALMVMENQKLVGIITERDYSRRVALKNLSSKTTTVEEIMQKPLFTVTFKDSANKCLQLMTEYRIRHLPVIERNILVGVVSMGDIVRTTIEDQEFLIDQLTCYVTGTNIRHLVVAST